ncbi:MAG: hypothetical protein RIQ90_299 [Bacteroidota bacterium]
MIPFGFEPKTYCLEGSCSIQLSYGTKIKKGMISHPHVGAAGFEPATSWSQTRRDDRTTLRPEQIIQKYFTFQSFLKRLAKVKNFEPFGFSSLPTLTSLRWERDSNPRYSYPYDSLANCWFQPLTHPT